MRLRLGLTPVTVAALACLTLGCGSKKSPGVAPGIRDAGSGSEPYDGSVVQPREDAGKTDSMPGDPEPGLSGNCAIDSNKIFTVAERAQPFTSTPLTVDPLRSEFVLPYVSAGKCLDAVHWSSMSGAATSGGPADAIALDTCALVRDTAATALADYWLIASIDNHEAPYDVWVSAYDAATGATDDPHRISQNAHVETAVAITGLASGDAALVAYADEDAREGQGLYVRALDNAGKPSAEAVRIAQSSSLYFTSLSLKPLGDGAGLAFVRYALDYSTSEIVFVALDAQGKPTRDPWVLASSAGPSPSVDFVLDSEGGGIVYSRAEAATGRQIWFQQIDATGVAAQQRTGTARAPALRIVGAPARGIDVSLTKLRTSFILTYRSLPAPGSSDARAMLRVYFLDRYGAVIGGSDVSYTSQAGGRTATAASNDGRVALAWNQVNDDGSSTLKLVRLPCLGN